MAGKMIAVNINDRPHGGPGGPPQGDRPMKARTMRRLAAKAAKKGKRV